MRQLLLIAVLFCAEVNAQVFLTEHGNAVFLSKAPLNEFEGKSASLKGLIDFEKNLIDFYLDLNTLKTGISLRDKHMRDNYLETKKFPFAEFSGKIQNLSEIDLNDLRNGKKVIAEGNFSIHGVSMPRLIEGTLSLDEKDQVLKLNCTFNVLLTDHNISKPSIMGYDLADVQQVSITATFQKQ